MERSQKLKATIFVASYNHEDTIETCLRSVFQNASDSDCEIIVHDDFSTDKSRDKIIEVMSSWKGQYKLVFPAYNRMGSGEEVFPDLIKEANGEVIFVVDGDDFWTTTGSNRVEIMHAAVMQHPDVAMAFTDTLKINTLNQQSQWMLKEPCKRDISSAELRKINYAYLHSGAACFRNVDVEFPEEFYGTTCQDIWYPMLWGAFGYAKYIEDAGALIYRFNGQGVWSSCDAAARVEKKAVFAQRILSYFARIGDQAAFHNNLWRLKAATSPA